MRMDATVRLIGGPGPRNFGEHLAGIGRLSGASVTPLTSACWRVAMPGGRYPLLRALLPWSRREGAMIAVSDAAQSHPLRGVLFDLDATLTACEFLDTLAAAAGFGERTEALTRAAMEGRMDFETSYRTRLQRFAGMPVARMQPQIDALPLAEGAADLCAALHARNLPTAIVTGGYARVGREVQQRLGIGRLYATELEECDGCLTGALAGPLLDAAAKVDALDDFCAHYGLQRADCAAVGDGANDLPLLAAAGCGILYTAAPDRPEQARPINLLLELFE